jgi:hypothetical protein
MNDSNKNREMRQTADRIRAMVRAANQQYLETPYASLEFLQRWNALLRGSIQLLRRNASGLLPQDALSDLVVEDFLKES